MKIFKITFSTLAALAAFAIAAGAYWHIYTLVSCALLVWAAKKADEKY